VFGLASIVSVIEGMTEQAAVLIILSVAADGADGAVARRFGTGALGENLDSLADIIAFGAAPAVVSYEILKGYSAYAAFVLPSLFLICGALRLARFNIMSKRDFFSGIPITLAGFIVALLILSGNLIGRAHELAILASLPVLSVLMVSTIQYPKVRNWLVLFPVIGLIAVLAVLWSLGSDMVPQVSGLLLVLMVIYILNPLHRMI